MNKKKLCVFVALMLVLASLAGFTYFHLGGIPGTGGPESIKPTRINGIPGTGGPESTRPVRWQIMPAMGGPE